MVLTKAFRAQEGICRLQRSSPTKKVTKSAKKRQNNPKMHNMLQRGGRAADILTINPSIFITDQKVSTYHKASHWPQKWPKPANKNQNIPQNCTFCSDQGPGRCHIGNQALYFHWIVLTIRFVGLKKVSPYHRGAPSANIFIPQSTTLFPLNGHN